MRCRQGRQRRVGGLAAPGWCRLACVRCVGHCAGHPLPSMTSSVARLHSVAMAGDGRHCVCVTWRMKRILTGGIEVADSAHGDEPRRNPAIITWRQAADMCTSLMNLLGMSPVSRSRLQSGDEGRLIRSWNSCGNAMARSRKSPAERYIDNVIRGKVTACRWVRLFCERHKRDLKTGRKRGLYFDRDAAQHAIDFYQFLRHSKGKWAGKTIDLEPWQQAIVWVLFGWQRRKTTGAPVPVWIRGDCQEERQDDDGLGAGALHDAGGRRGRGGGVQRGDEARPGQAWDEAGRMVKASPYLRQHITVHKDKIFLKWDQASKYVPLGRDSDTMDGLNVHCAIVDELHAHRTSEIWDVLETGTGARTQALMFGITTAGFNQSSFCYERRKYTSQVLDGVIEDDSHFGIIFTLDEGDDEWDEANWIKANPNLGISVDLDDLREQARKAKELPSALTSFLTKRLNIWTRAAEHFIHPDKWRACGGAFDVERLDGRTCFAGLDLSTRWILRRFVLVFPPTEDDPYFRVLPRFWVPETAMHERSQRDQVPYDAWCRDGWITAIPGDVIDYEWIYRQIDEDAQRYDLRRSGLIAGVRRPSICGWRIGADGGPDWAGVRLHVGADEGVGEADRLARAGAWRQSGADVDGLQHGGDARCGGNVKPDKKLRREDRRPGGDDHGAGQGDAARPGCAGRSVYEDRGVRAL